MNKEKSNKMIVYDLVFGVILIMASSFLVVASTTMTRPRTWLTAPGLPPLVISASLGFMGLLLFINAIKSGGFRLLRDKWGRQQDRPQSLLEGLKSKTMLLVSIFFGYFILSTKVMPFELATAIYLLVIFKLFWKKPLWITIISSVIITITFSLVFSNIFKIMLPGIAWRDLWFF